MITTIRILTVFTLLLTTVAPGLAGQRSPVSATPSPARDATKQPAPSSNAAKPPSSTDGATTRPKVSLTDERIQPKDYVIGPSDVLEIAVWNNDAVSRTVPVRPDGKISLPLVNDVQAAGLTAMQLKTALTTALTDYVQNAEISVIVREVHSFKVSVMGEVREPGRFDLTGRVTVLDVLAMARGFTEYADKNKIAVLRREQGVTRTIPFEYQRLVANDVSGGRENFFLQPDDIVLVR